MGAAYENGFGVFADRKFFSQRRRTVTSTFTGRLHNVGGCDIYSFIGATQLCEREMVNQKIEKILTWPATIDSFAPPHTFDDF